MIARKLLPPDIFSSPGQAIIFSDHTLFTETTVKPYICPEHIPGPGIITMLSGSGDYAVNHQVEMLDNSRFLLLDRNSRLSIRLPRPGVRPLLLFFHPALISEALGRQPADLAWLQRVHPMTGVLQERLEWLVRLGESCSSFGTLKADAIIREILQELIGQALAAGAQSEELQVGRYSTRVELFKRLSEVREWILAEYPSSITLKDMAARASLNSQHFLRMFRDCYGITPHQFLMDTRLEGARRLLADTKEPVTAICRQTGFESISSFSGLFRRRYGSSPSAYRKL